MEDAGPTPGAIYMSDEDYDDAIQATLAAAPPDDLWVFAYGSLLWKKPAFDSAESRQLQRSGAGIAPSAFALPGSRGNP